MRSPTVSFLVPCRNAEPYLERLFAAARAQSRPFDEFICYDDHSTDRTPALARSLGALMLSSDALSAGPSGPRNRLAASATGEWLHFHDADDLLAPEYLAHALAKVTDDTDVVVCDSSWELETTRRRIIHWTYRAEDYQEAPLAFTVSHPIGVISALVRRSAFLAVGGFDETKTCWEDADLFVRLAENGARFAFLEETLVTSLRHDRGVSSDQLHCNRCRLEFLRGYAQRHPASLRLTLAHEAEKLIPRFLQARDRCAARAALTLSRELGGDPPTTNNPGLSMLKHFLPAMPLIAWQARRRSASNP